MEPSSPYHGLGHHRGAEGSREVAEADPGVRGQLERQTPRGNREVFLFQTGNHGEKAQGVHLRLGKRALTTDTHATYSKIIHF